MEQVVGTDELASSTVEHPYSLAQIQKEVSVKSNLISRILMTVTPMMIVCSGLASGSSAMAQSAAAESFDRDCSNRTLHGDYGFTIEGLLGVPGPGLQLRGVALQHYDGKGLLTNLDHIVINGLAPTEEWRPGSGTYVVNPDCTGKATINIPSSGTPPLELHFVVVKQGREIRQVVDGNAITAVGIKVEAHERDRDGAGGGDR
jgi:hypothetical protein